MSFSTLRPQIKTLLDTQSEIGEVSGYPKVKFNTYPGVYVVPSDNESDYETTTENIRTYAFIVRVFYETKHTGVEDSLEALEELVDSLLDVFDQEDQKGASSRIVGINLPSGYTFLNIWATPAEWGEVPDESLLMAEVLVRVRISRDVT